MATDDRLPLRDPAGEAAERPLKVRRQRREGARSFASRASALGFPLDAVRELVRLEKEYAFRFETFVRAAIAMVYGVESDADRDAMGEHFGFFEAMAEQAEVPAVPMIGAPPTVRPEVVQKVPLLQFVAEIGSRSQANLLLTLCRLTPERIEALRLEALVHEESAAEGVRKVLAEAHLLKPAQSAPGASSPKSEGVHVDDLTQRRALRALEQAGYRLRRGSR